MEDYLNQIDWKALNGDFAPDIIRDLLSGDGAVQKLAFKKLEDDVFHVDRSEGAFHNDPPVPDILKTDLLLYTLPLILDILASDKFQFKRDLLNNLNRIAELHLYTYGNVVWFNKALQVRQQIWLKYSVIKMFLHDENEYLFREAVRLAAKFGEYADVILQDFTTIFSRASYFRKKDMLDAFNDYILPQQSPIHPAILRFVEQLKQEFANTDNPELHLRIAYTIVNVERDKTEPAYVSTLEDAFIDPQMPNFPRITALTITKLGYDKGISMLMDILTYDVGDVDTNIYVATNLLKMVFNVPLYIEFGLGYTSGQNSEGVHDVLGRWIVAGNGFVPPYERGRALSQAQKNAVKAILNCETLWMNNIKLLEVFGLPATPDKLKKLL